MKQYFLLLWCRYLTGRASRMHRQFAHGKTTSEKMNSAWHTCVEAGKKFYSQYNYWPN